MCPSLQLFPPGVLPVRLTLLYNLNGPKEAMAALWLPTLHRLEFYGVNILSFPLYVVSKRGVIARPQGTVHPLLPKEGWQLRSGCVRSQPLFSNALNLSAANKDFGLALCHSYSVVIRLAALAVSSVLTLRLLSRSEMFIICRREGE